MSQRDLCEDERHVQNRQNWGSLCESYTNNTNNQGQGGVLSSADRDILISFLQGMQAEKFKKTPGGRSTILRTPDSDIITRVPIPRSLNKKHSGTRPPPLLVRVLLPTQRCPHRLGLAPFSDAAPCTSRPLGHVILDHPIRATTSSVS